MADLLMKMPTPYEPKRQNRWIFRFHSDLGIQEWFVKTAARPKLTQSEVEIPFLNTKTFVLGKFEWDAISLTFNDPIGPSAAQSLMEWVRLHSESATGRQGYAAGYKKTCWLEMLDPTGVVIEKWEMQGCFLTNVDFGSLDYASDALAEISATLRMDRALLLY